jgi:lysophospholipase L1-like esterase
MAQLLCFGDSNVYGVGAVDGGWADNLKADLHSQMYGDKALGEKHEVYNLGVPGANAQDLLARFKTEVAMRTKNGKDIILIITIGTNDSKAVDNPNNYITTPDIFKEEIRTLLERAAEFSDKVICLGLPAIDDARTNPKGNSYFSSERIRIFETVLGEVCQEKGVIFIPLFEKTKQMPWPEEYLYGDGLHLNDKGHNWIMEQLRQPIADMLGE